MAFKNKTINLIIHNIAKKPKKVKGYKFEWNELNHTLLININLKNSHLKNIKIKLAR